MLMMLDARYLMLDGDRLATADVLIIDLEKYNFRHFFNEAKNPKTLYLYFKYIQEVVPIATSAAHILNPSWVVDRFMSLIRPLLRKEVAESFQFHSRGSESLHKSFSKEVLPEDYGGTAGSMDDLHKDWMKVFESKRCARWIETSYFKETTKTSILFCFREYLLNDENWKISE